MVTPKRRGTFIKGAACTWPIKLRSQHEHGKQAIAHTDRRERQPTAKTGNHVDRQTQGRTLWASRPLTLPARFVAVGLLSVGATAILGIAFALVLGGVSTNAHLLDVAALGLPIHVIAGLGGWLTFTAIGVSYRLLAMFMLAPELDGPSTRGALYLERRRLRSPSSAAWRRSASAAA